MKRTTLLILSGLLPLFIFAQPAPCGSNPLMTPTCQEACVICDIDGFTGINNSTQVTPAPPGFCTSIAHNITWIAFIAGSTNLTIELYVSNCITGEGLEIGLYKSLNCQSFQKVSNCDGDVNQGETAVITNTVPLVIGQYYYLVIDGNSGDICTYNFHVASGSTLVPPLMPTGDLQGPTIACQGGTVTYSLPQVTGANFYQWTIDNIPEAPGLSNTHPITWSSAGQHKVCVRAYNVCDTLPTTCMDVTVTPPPVTTLYQTVCFGDCVALAGNNYCSTGVFSANIPTPLGCDSTVTMNLTVLPPNKTQIFREICPGDSVQIGNQYFKETGIYTVNLLDYRSCDSAVTLTLNALPMTVSFARSQYGSFNISCVGLADGFATASVTGGTAPFTFLWENGVDTAYISDLQAGIYQLTVTDAKGCTTTAQMTLNEPQLLRFKLAIEQPTCLPPNSGVVMAIQVQGGMPPYMYGLNGQTLVANATFASLLPGDYAVLLEDANGCVATADTFLIEPNALTVDLGPDQFLDLGDITRLSPLLNLPVVSYVWADSTTLSCWQCRFPDAQPVTNTFYTLVATTAEGCSATDTVSFIVIPRRRIFVPNIFSPNDDGENDYFTVFAGPEVSKIRSLRVWSRWGELVVDLRDFAPNATYKGWDGTFRSQTLPNGVFTWQAEIEYIDGVKDSFDGNVTLLR